MINKPLAFDFGFSAWEDAWETCKLVALLAKPSYHQKKIIKITPFVFIKMYLESNLEFRSYIINIIIIFTVVVSTMLPPSLPPECFIDGFSDGSNFVHILIPKLTFQKNTEISSWKIIM